LILVDTSVWVDHARSPIDELEGLLAAALIVQHPFVTGELSLGNLSDRNLIIQLLNCLPPATVAADTDFLTFVAHTGLAGTGIGFVDAHLLAACRLAPGTLLWSRDKRLDRWADNLQVAWRPG
jgi:predicted nucleic acid-binding protein